MDQQGSQQDRSAYEDYKRSGGTGPDGQPLPEFDQADERTRQHVATKAAQRHQGGQSQR